MMLLLGIITSLCRDVVDCVCKPCIECCVDAWLRGHYVALGLHLLSVALPVRGVLVAADRSCCQRDVYDRPSFPISESLELLLYLWACSLAYGKRSSGSQLEGLLTNHIPVVVPSVHIQRSPGNTWAFHRH